ncbi:hypothetical protein DLREEDagrD3_26290 [Denitratisoma sp. agr-D3]
MHQIQESRGRLLGEKQGHLPAALPSLNLGSRRRWKHREYRPIPAAGFQHMTPGLETHDNPQTPLPSRYRTTAVKDHVSVSAQGLLDLHHHLSRESALLDPRQA